MSAARNSNRMIAYSLLFAVLGLCLFWLLWVKPTREQILRAKQNGVISINESLPASNQKFFNTKIKPKIQLRQAAARGDWQQIRVLLASGFDINGDVGNVTVLMTAAQHGQTKLIRELLANGAKTETQDDFKNTALLYAARYGQNHAIQVLLEHGADLHAKNMLTGLNALDLAIIGRHEQTYKFLKDRNIEVNLLQAITVSDENHLRKLLAQGADVNEFYVAGNPLAYQQNNSGLILPSASSERTSRTVIHPASIMSSPLSGALTLQQWKTAEFLLKHGAKVDQQDSNGSTALMYAASQENLQAVKFLIQHGAKVNQQGLFGQTALMSAVQSGKLETVRFLLEQKADVNLQGQGGTTAPMAGVLKAHNGVIDPPIRNAARTDVKPWKDEGVYNIIKYAPPEKRAEMERIFKEASQSD